MPNPVRAWSRLYFDWFARSGFEMFEEIGLAGAKFVEGRFDFEVVQAFVGCTSVFEVGE